MNNIWTIVPAAGSGQRLGMGIPKAFVKLHNRTILETTLFNLYECGLVNVVIPLPVGYRIPEIVVPGDMELEFVEGGERRQDSVLNAAAKIPADAEIVLIHDAARPFVDREVIKSLIDGARNFGACMPVLPSMDTLKKLEGDYIAQTVDRGTIYSIQTPQTFRMDVFSRILTLYGSVEVTDDCALSEVAGYKPRWVNGSILTFKITSPQELELARLISASRE